MYYAGIEKKKKSKGVLKGNKESSQGKRRQAYVALNARRTILRIPEWGILKSERLI